MATKPADTFAVYEFTECNSEEEYRAEEIRILGYSVVPAVLGEDELRQAREKIDSIYRTQLEEVGGEEVVRRINDEHVARAPLAYDEFFLDVAASPQILAIVNQVLGGGYFQLHSQNGIINVPSLGQDQAAGAWHRDLNYQHFVSSRPLAASALFCIDDFSGVTGGTHVLPGSHKVEAFPSPAFTERRGVQIEAAAGSVIVFDSMMYHRTGLNTSAGPRRAINHMYTAPMIKQQLDLPVLLDGRYEDDPALRRLLGYESRPEESVKEFRLRRLARLDR
jgi:ectoine hydroxylase-related dioxygenase (phytanoyl-CoA dioxygenase family)